MGLSSHQIPVLRIFISSELVKSLLPLGTFGVIWVDKELPIKIMEMSYNKSNFGLTLRLFYI